MKIFTRFARDIMKWKLGAGAFNNEKRCRSDTTFAY